MSAWLAPSLESDCHKNKKIDFFFRFFFVCGRCRVWSIKNKISLQMPPFSIERQRIPRVRAAARVIVWQGLCNPQPHFFWIDTAWVQWQEVVQDDWKQRRDKWKAHTVLGSSKVIWREPVCQTWLCCIISIQIAKTPMFYGYCSFT